MAKEGVEIEYALPQYGKKHSIPILHLNTQIYARLITTGKESHKVYVVLALTDD